MGSMPLSRAASRGDQILNARSFASQGFSLMMEEEDVTKEKLLGKLAQLEENREKLTAAMEAAHTSDGTKNVIELIKQTIEERQ